jgi:hypothetical protein
MIRLNYSNGEQKRKSEDGKIIIKSLSPKKGNGLTLIFSIRSCNTVIRYNGIKGIKSLVQSRGRARHRESRFIGSFVHVILAIYFVMTFSNLLSVMCRKEEKEKMVNIMQQEKIMKGAINQLLQPTDYDLESIISGNYVRYPVRLGVCTS